MRIYNIKFEITWSKNIYGEEFEIVRPDRLCIDSTVRGIKIIEDWGNFTPSRLRLGLHKITLIVCGRIDKLYLPDGYILLISRHLYPMHNNFIYVRKFIRSPAGLIDTCFKSRFRIVPALHVHRIRCHCV